LKLLIFLTLITLIVNLCKYR